MAGRVLSSSPEEGECLTASQVSERVMEWMKKEGKLTDDLLLSLHRVYGPVAASALDILDRGSVMVVIAQPSGRSFWKVNSKKRGAGHVTMTHWCSCLFHQFDVVNTKKAILCKHQLAACIAEATHVISVREPKIIEDGEYYAMVGV